MSEQNEIVRPQDLANYIWRIANGMGDTVETLIKKTVDAFESEEEERIAGENKRIASENKRIASENERQAVMGNLVEALEGIKQLISGESKAALSIAYPVGAVYISFEKTSPSVLFGGTWEAIEDGRFLMATEGLAEIKGGASDHNHLAGNLFAEFGMSGFNLNEIRWNDRYVPSGYTPDGYVETNASATLINNIDTGSTNNNHVTQVGGETANGNNIPPYITVFMWRRIA